MKKRRKDRDISQIEDECLACLAFIAYRTRRTTKREICKTLAATTRLTENTEDEKRSRWWEYKFSNMHFAFKPLEGRVINGFLLEPSTTKGAESNPGVQANIRDYALEYFLNDFDRCVSMARAALDKPLPSDIEEAVFGTTAGVPSKAYISQSEADAIAKRSPEGAKRLRQHWYLERDSSLPKEAKRRFEEVHGELYCEACGLRPVPTYGHPLVDAHHRIPLSEYAKRGKLETEPTDFVILCPSCHRAVHKHDDCDIDALKASLPKGGIIFRS